MSKISVWRHRFETIVNLSLAIGDGRGRPFYGIVLKHFFVQLMKYVGGDTDENVTMGELRALEVDLLR